jgi:hypothetical protein
MNPPDVRFPADAMLQSLAKWLLGYDCAAGDDLFGRKVVRLFADHRRRSSGGFVLETFHRKSATARGREAHRLCAHDGLFAVKRRTRPIFRWLGKPPSKPM